MIIREDDVATFECIVTGKPVPEIKWYRGHEEIIPVQGTEITFNPESGHAKLSILKPATEKEEIYRVRAINKFGKAECRANLLVRNVAVISQPEVLYAPKITKPLPACIAEKGRSLTLVAEFEGKPKPEVKWFKNGIEIKPTDKQTVEIQENRTELVIPDMVKKDSGKYEVRIQNTLGEAKSSGSVTVKETDEFTTGDTDKPQAPYFKTPLQPQIANIDEVVIIEATVDSYPMASFQWFYENKPLESTASVKIATKENRSILLIKQMAPQYAGPYTCRAENVAGSVTCTANVNILETTWEESTEINSPTFVKRLSPIRVMDGEGVDFTCILKGKPTPKVQWYHNDKPIEETKGISIIQDTEGICNLAIAEVFPEDAGEYTCQALNPVGEALSTTTLIVDGKNSMRLKFY